MEKAASSARTNYIYNLAYQILNVFMPLATAPYIARVIGSEGVGISSYYSTIAGYFATFAMLGLTNYGSRAIARSRDNQKEQNLIFSSLFYMQIILSIVMGILYAGYILFFVKYNVAMAWLHGIAIATSLINLNWYFWGIEEFKITITRSVIVKIITFIFIFIFVRDVNDILIYNCILILGNFLGNVPLILVAHKYVKIVKVSFSSIVGHFKPNMILFIPILSTTLYRTVDKVMLGALVDFREVGYYENADKIISICLGCITALGQVMMPKVSNLWATGQTDECNRLTKKSFCFSTFFAATIMFGLLSVSDTFIPVFLGEEFFGAISILSVLSISFLFLAWANVLKTQVLIARGSERIYIESTVLGVGCNVVLNSILIPFMEGNGAAIATTITEALVFFYIAYRIRREISTLWLIKSSFKYLIVGAMMMLIIVLLKPLMAANWVSLIILICIGGGVFGIGCSILALCFNDQLILDILRMISIKVKKNGL